MYAKAFWAFFAQNARAKLRLISQFFRLSEQFVVHYLWSAPDIQNGRISETVIVGNMHVRSFVEGSVANDFKHSVNGLVPAPLFSR